MTTRQMPASALDAALDAAADLLLQGSVSPAASLAVGDVCRSAGLGVSAFYRAFGSVTNFHLDVVSTTIDAVFEQSDRSFFEDMGGITETDLAVPDPYAVVIQHYVGSIPDELDDPLTAFWAWLSYPPSAAAFLASAVNILATRSAVYATLIAGFGGVVRPDSSAEQIAGLHMTVGKTIELYSTIVAGDERENVRILETELLYDVVSAALVPLDD